MRPLCFARCRRTRRYPVLTKQRGRVFPAYFVVGKIDVGGGSASRAALQAVRSSGSATASPSASPSTSCVVRVKSDRAKPCARRPRAADLGLRLLQFAAIGGWRQKTAARKPQFEYRSAEMDVHIPGTMIRVLERKAAFASSGPRRWRGKAS